MVGLQQRPSWIIEHIAEIKGTIFKFAAKTDESINNLKYVKGVKVAGKVVVVAGAASTLYETYDDAFNNGVLATYKHSFFDYMQEVVN